ncbi:MAG: hypothetical protein AAB630_01390 [Patescibacteria group bacterium]
MMKRTMVLRGIDFGPVLDASGTRGFFGEGYPYHEIFSHVGLDFAGSTFVAKTMTLEPRTGNMRGLRADGTMPWLAFRQSCIVVRPLKGVALNAVGLSNPGAEALFSQKLWQNRTDPFFLSFMSAKETMRERIEELKKFINLFCISLRGFSRGVGLQLNYSCPNAGVHHDDLVAEVRKGLSIASSLRIPLMPKFNVLFPIEAAAEISKDPACDALCVSNTIPWGQLHARIDWRDLFGASHSPLARFGGGGLSGAPLLPLTAEWVRNARAQGITKPINAGGGILRPRDVVTLAETGASSVFIGSVAMLRPWRVHRIIKKAHKVFTMGAQ